MNQVLFDSWNPRLKRGEGSHSVFQPYSFVKDSSGTVPGFPELYEVRRELIFTVLTQYAYGDHHSARSQENADKALLRLVTNPFVSQAQTVLLNIYARDLDKSIAEMEKLLRLLTEGQTTTV